MEKNKKNNKYGLLKVIGVAFLIFSVLTWIIKAGTFSGETYQEYTDGIYPVGLFGLFINPAYSFGIFIQYFLYFLSIGGLYGVLNKTGVYSSLIDKLSNFCKKSKIITLTFISVLFALLSAFIGNQIVLFILVPFAVAVLLKCGFGKITSIAATVGAIILGIASAIFGTDVLYISYFQADKFSGIIYKLVFFTILNTIYVLFLLYQNGLLKNKNKDRKLLETNNEKIIPLYEEVKTKKSYIPLMIVLILFIFVVIIGYINWDYTFGISWFTELNTIINESEILLKIFGYDIPVIGYIGYYDITAIVLIFTFLIKWIYSIKFDEFIDGFVSGVKQIIRPATYAILASIIFAVIINSSDNYTSYSISATISSWILKLNSQLYVLVVTLLGFVGGFFYNDFSYLVNSIYGPLGSFGSANITVMGLILQSGYSLAMLCLPVSVILVAALSYLNVSYKEWMKYIYKFLLIMFILVIILGLIASAI